MRYKMSSGSQIWKSEPERDLNARDPESRRRTFADAGKKERRGAGERGREQRERFVSVTSNTGNTGNC